MIKLKNNEGAYETLRFGSLNDIDTIIAMADKLHKRSVYHSLSLDLKKVRAGLERFIVEGQSNFLVLVSEDNGKPVGILVAYAYEPIFSQDRVAIEVLWFLEDEYRKSTRGVEMADAFEYWAKMIGCKLAQYGYLSSADPGMQKFYERRGMKMVEMVYHKEL
jgi:GNAT superfamily N-acetyltransferase